MNLSQKIHRFYLNFGFFVSILAGFLFFSFFPSEYFGNLIWLFFALGLAIFAFRYARKISMAIIIIAGIIISGYRFADFYHLKNSFLPLTDKTVKIRGAIAEDIDQDKGVIKAKIELTEVDGHRSRGKIFAKILTRQSPRRGDMIEVSGKATTGFGIFVMSFSRAKLLSWEKRPDLVRDLRDNFAQQINQVIVKPQSSLGLGYLLGQKSSLPEKLETSLRATGLTHIVVASGYNLTILAILMRRIFEKKSLKLTILCSALLIAGFVIMVGFSPAMIRAGMVAMIGLIVWAFGREVNPYFLLTYVAAVTLLWSPESIFDLGWQLSFGAFFGVIIFSPILRRYLFSNPDNINPLLATFFETFSAQICTFPIIAVNFGSFSIISIIANMAVLPFIPIAMLMTFLSGVAAIIYMPLAQLVGFLANLILKISISVVYFFASFKDLQFELKIDLNQTIVCYVIIVGLLIFLEYKNRTNRINLAKNLVL